MHYRFKRKANGRWTAGTATSCDGVITDTSPAWTHWQGERLDALLMSLFWDQFAVYVRDDERTWHRLPNPTLPVL